MIKKRHLLIVIWTIVFMPMCVKWKLTHLNSSELRWIDHYNTGTKTRYISNIGNIDTLVITSCDISNSLWPFYQHIGYDGEYIAGGYVEYKIIHDNDTIEGFSSIDKCNYNEPVYLAFILGDRYAIKDSTFPFGLPLYGSMRFVEINGRIFNDCIVIDDSNSRYRKYATKTNKISEFVWSKSEGLLRYSFENGDFFLREDLLLMNSNKHH